MVDAVTVGSPLGCSDYATLLFLYATYAEHMDWGIAEARVETHPNILSILLKFTEWSILSNQPPDVSSKEFVKELSLHINPFLIYA